MGKGTIVSHIEGGQYNLTINFKRSRTDASIASIAVQIADLTTRIAATPPGQAQDLLILQRTSLEKWTEYLEDNLTADITTTAWCADTIFELTGEVGTIEVPGERGTVLIQPGYDSNAVYDAERDGQLVPAVEETPAGMFYNKSLMPGWQKYMPTFRFGTLTAVDVETDTCDLTLAAAISSQQSLDVNQATELEAVPVSYMTCNASAFTVGDDVVVEFEDQDWDNPIVIGFKDNPQPCGCLWWASTPECGVISPLYGGWFKVFTVDLQTELATTSEWVPRDPDRFPLDHGWWLVKLVNRADVQPNAIYFRQCGSDAGPTSGSYIWDQTCL